MQFAAKKALVILLSLKNFTHVSYHQIALEIILLPIHIRALIAK